MADFAVQRAVRERRSASPTKVPLDRGLKAPKQVQTSNSAIMNAVRDRVSQRQAPAPTPFSFGDTGGGGGGGGFGGGGAPAVPTGSFIGGGGTQFLGQRQGIPGSALGPQGQFPGAPGFSGLARVSQPGSLFGPNIPRTPDASTLMESTEPFEFSATIGRLPASFELTPSETALITSGTPEGLTAFNEIFGTDAKSVTEAIDELNFAIQDLHNAGTFGDATPPDSGFGAGAGGGFGSGGGFGGRGGGFGGGGLPPALPSQAAPNAQDAVEQGNELTQLLQLLSDRTPGQIFEMSPELRRLLARLGMGGDMAALMRLLGFIPAGSVENGIVIDWIVPTEFNFEAIQSVLQSMAPIGRLALEQAVESLVGTDPAAAQGVENANQSEPGQAAPAAQ